MRSKGYIDTVTDENTVEISRDGNEAISWTMKYSTRGNINHTMDGGGGDEEVNPITSSHLEHPHQNDQQDYLE